MFFLGAGSSKEPVLLSASFSNGITPGRRVREMLRAGPPASQPWEGRRLCNRKQLPAQCWAEENQGPPSSGAQDWPRGRETPGLRPLCWQTTYELSLFDRNSITRKPPGGHWNTFTHPMVNPWWSKALTQVMKPRLSHFSLSNTH